jgi:uncharacterized iron-regulated membrane protein
VAALFLLVLAGTGCVMAFESEIDGFLRPSLFKVIPHGEALPLSEILPRVPGELIRWQFPRNVTLLRCNRLTREAQFHVL